MNRAAPPILISALLSALLPCTARAEYARPPDEPYSRPYPGERYAPPPDEDAGHEPRSVVRLFTGPVLRFADQSARGGLMFALDAGSRAAGARLSGAWVRAGSDGGLSQYTAEIWIDFAASEPLHPVLAAGAAAARLDRETGGRLQSDVLGVGLLRGALQYRLPVNGVDARASLDVTGSVPAVGARAADVAPWITAAVTVGVGF